MKRRTPSENRFFATVDFMCDNADKICEAFQAQEPTEEQRKAQAETLAKLEN